MGRPWALSAERPMFSLSPSLQSLALMNGRPVVSQPRSVAAIPIWTHTYVTLSFGLRVYQHRQGPVGIHRPRWYGAVLTWMIPMPHVYPYLVGLWQFTSTSHPYASWIRGGV